MVERVRGNCDERGGGGGRARGAPQPMTGRADCGAQRDCRGQAMVR